MTKLTPIPKHLAWLCIALTLCGCIGGERVKLDHQSPAPSTGAPLRPIGLSVSDEREVVKRFDKDEWYLGEAPGSDGKDLSNHQLIPLAHQIRNDLVDELASLGYDDVTDKNVRKLVLVVREWHLDAETRRMRYRIEVEVLEHHEGHKLAQTTVQGDKLIGGDDEKAMKSQVRAAYAAIVPTLVRDNPTVLAALR
jgi:hypothetical protein